MKDSQETSVAHARQIMDAVAAKAPAGGVESFAPYLRAAITYWRFVEESARAARDMQAELDAVALRITSEDRFRRVEGRSFNTVADAITIDDVHALPNPS